MCELLLFRFRSSIMEYLFLVSIGPVQDFIASARRSRDLAFGSWLLSELSKAAANKIKAENELKSLIFPAPDPQDKDSLSPGNSLNVANKIVAVIDQSPQTMGEEVRTEKVKFLYKNYGAGPAERLSGVDLLKRKGSFQSAASGFPSTSHMAT